MTPDLSFLNWPVNAADAVIIQNDLRHRIHIKDDFNQIDLIAGVDVSYDIQGNLTRAFVVLMTPGDLKPILSVRSEVPTTFPYIPGFLSFREIPAIIEAMKKLPEMPQLLMVDGQGIAHPRRLGIAAHLGVLTDLPSIGVAKSRLTGHHGEPGPLKGDHVPLLDKGVQIGTVLRSKDHVAPLYVSPGHRVSQETALALTLQCLQRHRLPEPTRIADKASKEKPGKVPQPDLFTE